MSTVAYDVFLPGITPWVADCPDLVILDAVRSAVADFCTETAAWAVVSDPVDGVANQGEYDIDAPSGTIVTELSAVSYSDVPLEAKTPTQLDFLLPGWRTSAGVPAFYYRSSDSTVVLAPMPLTDQTEAIVMRFAVAPDPFTGRDVDSDLAAKYRDAICAGALGKLLLLPGSWTNPKLASAFMQQFNFVKGDARTVAYAGRSSAQLQVRARKFF